MAPLRTVLITTALALTTAVAHADSSVYIGAGVGRGHVSDIYHTGEIPGLGPFFHIDNATAWDAIIGLRPVQPFAVEATYIDLGSDTYHWNNGQVSYNAHAAALYAIGFLPLPLPHLEVYGKAGLAQWQLNGKTYISIVPLDRMRRLSSPGALACNCTTAPSAFGSNTTASRSCRRVTPTSTRSA